MYIVNWNCGGLASKRRDVELLSANADIICIAETKFNNRSTSMNIKNFLFIRKDSSNQNYSGGLLTLIRKDIKFNRIYLHNVDENIEYTAIKIRLNQEEI